MSDVYDWIRTIVIFMIFNTLIMNIFGDSSYKKYIQLVTGMILVVLVITPIIDFLRLSDRVEDLFEMQLFEADASDFKLKLQTMEEKQQEVILLEYKERVIDQAEELVGEYDYTIVSSEIEFDTNEESESFGRVKHMSLVLCNRESEEKEMGKVTIDRIVISERKEEVVAMAPSPTEINLKKRLSDFYNVEKDNININIQGGSYE